MNKPSITQLRAFDLGLRMMNGAWSALSRELSYINNEELHAAWRAVDESLNALDSCIRRMLREASKT